MRANERTGSSGGTHHETALFWRSSSLLCDFWEREGLMAQRIVFHYFSGNSCLHRWDPRCKFLGLLAITATLVRIRIEWLILDSVLFLGLLLLSLLPLKSFLRGLWSWMIFLLVLFLFQVFSTPGTPIARFSWIPLSREGLRLGTLTFFRLALLLCYAILFTAITRPRELQDALVWILKPFPFLPGGRIGLMVSLVLRFFSGTLDQAEEVRLALKARLGDNQRNPSTQGQIPGPPYFTPLLFKGRGRHPCPRCKRLF